MPPLAGIVHAAAVMDDNRLVSLDWMRFRKVMQPKIEGAWNLHQLTLDRPLDFFICFSSLITLVGTHGQAGYTAANYFLDCLAHHRRALGRPGLSVNWGAWGQVGRARDRGDALLNRRLMGIQRFTPGQALEALKRLVKREAVQAGFVIGLDLRVWFRNHPHALNFDYYKNVAVGPVPSDEGLGEAIRDELFAAESGSARVDLLGAYLRRKAGELLKIAPAQIEMRTPLASLGFNSLLSLELRHHLEMGLGVKLHATLIYNYPTIQELTRFLADRMGLAPATDMEHPQEDLPSFEPESDEIEETLAHLSDEEAEALLIDQLNELDKEDELG